MAGSATRGKELGLDCAGDGSADVLIVGAGAAGCTLAYLLAREGRRVVLAERRITTVGDKPCGGALTAQGQRLMERIWDEGVLDAMGAAHIDAMRVLYRDLRTTLPMRFRALPRRRLDTFLLEQATHAGALLVEGGGVVCVDETARVATLRAPGARGASQLEYGTLVAADGAASTLRRLVAGRRPRTVVSLLAEAGLAQCGTRMYQRIYPGVAGGCWLIPQGDGAVVGCLFFPEASADPVGDPRSRVLDFAEELGCETGRLRGAPVPTGDDVLLRSNGGTYFVGDAAGLVEPALGAGIHLALRSAMALADDILGGEPYERAMASTTARLLVASDDVASTYTRLGLATLMPMDEGRAKQGTSAELRSKRGAASMG